MVLFDKVCIKCLECQTTVCVRIHFNFSSTFNESDDNRQKFFTQKLPQIIVNEFYHRHIFEQDEPISPVAHDDQNTDANNVYDGPRLAIGCTKLGPTFQRIKPEMRLEYKYLKPA